MLKIQTDPWDSYESLLYAVLTSDVACCLTVHSLTVVIRDKKALAARSRLSHTTLSPGRASARFSNGGVRRTNRPEAVGILSYDIPRNAPSMHLVSDDLGVVLRDQVAGLREIDPS